MYNNHNLLGKIKKYCNCSSYRLFSPSEKQVIEVPGGFPYLVRLIFDRCVSHNFTIKRVLENTNCETCIFHEHLQQHASLADAFKKVLSADSPIELGIESAFKLNSLGLINLHGSEMTVSCGLYRDYFQKCF